MSRIPVIAAAVTMAVGLANAGQIQLGGTSGLTSSYITTGCSNNDGSGGCIAGGISGTVTEKNFDSRLFATAALGATTVSPYTTSTITGPGAVKTDANYNEYGGNASGNKLYDSTNLETFSMISDGCNGTVKTCPGGTATTNLSNDFWDVQSANAVLTIPVGVLDVNDAYLMLQNVFGLAGASDTKLTFDFGTSSNTVSTSINYTLTNASGGGPTVSGGQIRTGLDCSTPSACQNTYATGTPNGSGNALPAGLSSVVVNNLYAGAYNNVVGGVFANSSGNAMLDDIGFNFSGAVTGLYLVDIKVTELVGGSNSNTSVTAATVDSTFVQATPEPSTFAMLFAGAAGLGVLVRRRRRA